MNIEFLVALAAKATVLAAAGLLCWRCLRRSSAAARHLVCAASFGALLLLPALMLIVPAWLPISGLPTWVDAAAATGHAGQNGRAAVLSGWGAIVLAVWCAGTAVGLARIGLGSALLGSALKRGMATDSAEWRGALARAGEDLKLEAKRVQLCFGGVTSPVAFGIRRPAILLPEAARDWSDVYRQTVLLHELAHVRRRDGLWNRLSQIALAIFWFHPAVWLLYGILRREEELACDDAVLQCGVQPAVYAGILLDMTRTISSRFLLASGMPGKGDAAHLHARFKHILQARHAAEGHSTACRIALGFLFALLVGCAASHTQQTDAGHVFKIGGDVSSPKLLSKLEPQYSDAAKKDKIQGTTLLSVVIGPDGVPGSVQVRRGLRADLDQNAIAAVQAWRFEPGRRQGVPVPVSANIEVNFRLQ